ncbi:MAG TPA: 16S rRNA (adenine(1518)-N(6)/adenine(1519)-N(6))-dimethyltransferase RsmA [Oculatellaceae cyanobacterium]|jgi:16S rRNA (adenine1518-N6/adenine1519-N6)-dimethyltransferase
MRDPSTSMVNRKPNNLLEEARQLRLKKRFSQNFLVNETVLDRIADVQHLGERDTVLEIGAGAGFLTEKLLQRGGQVIAVEVDPRMCRYLRERFANRPNLRLVEQDILKFDFNTIEAPRFHVVGNLPYQITSKILFLLAGELWQMDYPIRKRICQMTVMVQKEVAERIVAVPGQKAYNPLSIALQYWFEARLDFLVPSRDFFPPPKVESAVVTLTPRQAPLMEVKDPAVFSKLIRIAFAQKRKTVRNALLNGGFASATVLDRIFSLTGIDPGLRAEALPIDAFGELSNAFGSDTCQD